MESGGGVRFLLICYSSFLIQRSLFAIGCLPFAVFSVAAEPSSGFLPGTLPMNGRTTSSVQLRASPTPLPLSDLAVRGPGLRPVFRTALFLGAAQATALAASVLIHVAALRWLPVAEYALLGLVLVVGAGLQSLLAGGIPNALRRAAGACSDPAALILAPGLWLHLALCGGAWLGLVWLAIAVARWTGNADAGPVMAAAATELFVRAGLLDPFVFILNGSACGTAK